MTILVTYASKHGATAGIAERIGATLQRRGVDACVLPTSDVRELQEYDAAVIGSAVYMGRWMKEATSFVRRHQTELTRIPVWLFSSGPVGPKPMPEAADLAELRTLLSVQGDVTFDGALDTQKLSLPERMMVKAVRAPYGDYRAWDRIDEWTCSIAASLELHATPVRAQ
ncbi:MAG: flavodoxin domain-containing protein [Candidatus Dormiibacterota bacterium]